MISVCCISNDSSISYQLITEFQTVSKLGEEIFPKYFKFIVFKIQKSTCDTISVENIQPYKRGKECFATLLANSKPSTFPKRVCINKPNITVLLIITGKSWSQSPR